MTERRAIGRPGLRLRITIAFLGGALAVSALVAGTTYVLAERYLSSRRIDDSVQQAFAGLRDALRYLSQPAVAASGEEVDLEALGAVLEAHADNVLLDPEADGIDYYASSLSITPTSVPGALSTAVERGEVGYAYRNATPRQLVFGSPLPQNDIRAYFFFALTDLDQTLRILRNVLVGVSAGAVALAALAGSRVSARVVDPVRRASRAARRVAEGLLETRLPVSGRDELAAMAASFNEMAAALEERITRERRFVGDVSHELRTPLTTLRASTDYLVQHGRDLPPAVRRAVELLAADLEYLQRLVDDLLDLSRVEAGRVDMAWERLSLADLAREVVARRTRSGQGAVRIEFDGDPETLSTVADKQRLERVVGNLVDNALVHGGGDVTVRVAADDGALLVSVEDRGPGIPPEAGYRIFERFYKADPARRRGDGRGAGLGLAIARENAHLHGGEILVHSGRSGGTRFTLRLPRREQEPEP
ncbi:MAG TPA: HAMP domain-containing sensor histidine kinase [Actinomycetota bacterium]|nr:HAMP domain-containing sensor histidine kinase [Actinomycetota bacterium]